MNWTDYLQAVFALIFVLGLVGFIIVVLRRLGYGAGTPTIGHRNKRVRIAEVTSIDPRRRLVLVRHDQREHLILMGMNGETLIESRDAPEEDPYLQQANPASSNGPGASFRQALGQAIGSNTSTDKAKMADKKDIQ